MNHELQLCHERDRWEGLLRAGSHAHFLQSWAWGEVKSVSGWAALRCVLGAGRAPVLAQLLIKRFDAITMAYVPRGPLWGADMALNAQVLEGLSQLACEQGATFLRVEPDTLVSDALAAGLSRLLAERAFQPARPAQPLTSLHLSLLESEERLLAGCSKGHRADIRRAEREGVTISADATPEQLERFYELLAATASRAGFSIHPRDYYQRLVDELRREAGAARQAPVQLLLAYYQAQPVAGCLVVCWGDQAAYLYGGSNELGLRCRANHLAQWSAILGARARGCRLYDFWGVPDAAYDLLSPGSAQTALQTALENDPLSGVYGFKKGWGGSLVRYLPGYERIYDQALYERWRGAQES